MERTPMWRMAMKLFVLALTAGILIASAQASDPGSPIPGDAAAATTVLVLRHADRAPDGSDALTEAGKQRAESLRHVAGWAKLKAIYTTPTARSKATAAPLADCLGITQSTYPYTHDIAGDVKRLAQEIVSHHAGENVLVVGHGDTIVPLIRAFGVDPTSFSFLMAYDTLFVVTVYGPGKAKVLQLKYGNATEDKPCESR